MDRRGINHLQLYSHMDVALDQFRTAVPTTAGSMDGGASSKHAREGMVGQLSASLLHHAGCERWIADDIDNYVSIATNLAAQGRRESTKRIQLRNALERSDLADGTRLSRELERIFRGLRHDINYC